MPTPFFQIVVDCRSPSVLVAFWQPLLGHVVPPPPQGHATWRDWYVSVGVPPGEVEGDGTDRLAPADGVGPTWWFQPVPEAKVVKNRLHVDLRVSPGRTVPRAERRAAIELVAAEACRRGGSLLRLHEDEPVDHVFALMADPEGNEFCLV